MIGKICVEAVALSNLELMDFRLFLHNGPEQYRCVYMTLNSKVIQKQINSKSRGVLVS